MTTGIEWTDETWNPLVGCSYASPGCLNCYAAREAAGRLSGHPVYKGLAIRKPGQPAEFTGEVRTLPERLDQPIRWKRPRRVFVNSMSDLFHPEVPSTYIARVYAVMAAAGHHQFQLLTKRPKRRQQLLAAPIFRDTVADYLAKDHNSQLDVWPLPNVWEGTSVEAPDQLYRVRQLMETDAALRWLSAEPLLGALDLRPYLGLPGLDWVVVGGESGPGARPMHPAWARDIRDQCAEEGVPFLFKQWGEWSPDEPGAPVQRAWVRMDGELAQPGDTAWLADTLGAVPMARVGKRAAGRVLDGVTHDGYPHTENPAQLAL